MKLIPLPAVIARVSLQRTAIYKLIKRQKFPAPVKVGGASRWVEDEVDAFITAAAAARPTMPTTPPSS